VDAAYYVLMWERYLDWRFCVARHVVARRCSLIGERRFRPTASDMSLFETSILRKLTAEVGSALAAREKLDPEESVRSQPKAPMTAARAGSECERSDCRSLTLPCSRPRAPQREGAGHLDGP
jgi:hypothetical protein